jgi:hypothetical protein
VDTATGTVRYSAYGLDGLEAEAAKMKAVA